MTTKALQPADSPSRLSARRAADQPDAQATLHPGVQALRQSPTHTWAQNRRRAEAHAQNDPRTHPGPQPPPRTELPGQPYWLIAWLWLAALVYGSFLPFDPIDTGRVSSFTFGGLLPDGSLLGWTLAWLTQPRRLDGPLDDLLTNLLLYLPVGAMLRLHLWRAGRTRLTQILAPILVVLIVPWLVECTQGLTPFRDASLRDLLANAGGGAIGVLLAVKLRAVLRRRLVHAWWRAVPALDRGYRRLAAWRNGSTLRTAILLCHALLLAVWALRIARQWPGWTPEFAWLPFAELFEHPYGEATWIAYRTASFYLLALLLVSLQWLCWRDPRTITGLFFYLLLLGAGRELHHAVTRARAFDVSEPLLAAVVGAGVVGLIAGARHMVRAADRRRGDRPVAVDRRTPRFVAR